MIKSRSFPREENCERISRFSLASELFIHTKIFECVGDAGTEDQKISFTLQFFMSVTFGQSFLSHSIFKPKNGKCMWGPAHGTQQQRQPPVEHQVWWWRIFPVREKKKLKSFFFRKSGTAPPLCWHEMKAIPTWGNSKKQLFRCLPSRKCVVVVSSFYLASSSSFLLRYLREIKNYDKSFFC